MHYRISNFFESIRTLQVELLRKRSLGFVFVFFIVPFSLAQNICGSVFGDDRFTFPRDIQKINSNEFHTIEDIPAYLISKLGADTYADATKDSTRFYIIRGPGKDIWSFFLKNEILDIQEIENSFGSFNVIKVSQKNGQTSYVFTNVNGESRYLQLLSFLRLAKVPEYHIHVKGSLVSYKDIYKSAFKTIGKVPDLVIFGFANTALESIVENANSFNKKHFLKENREYASRKWIKPRFDEHELKNIGVQVAHFSNDKTLWLIDNEYGDRAAVLMEALQEYGASNILLLGTAGSLNPTFKVGDLVSPNAYFKADGQYVKSNSVSTTIAKRGIHAHIDSPALETKKWLGEQIRKGVDFVDVELQKVSEVVQPDTRFDAYLVVSDELNSETIRDYTQWTEEHRKNVKQTLWPVLRDSFEAIGVKANTKLMKYKIFYFLSPRCDICP